MKRETKRRNNKGFSLVELIIVIAIMAILAGILAPQFIKYINKSRVSTDIQNAQQMATALSAEFADTERKTAVAEQTVTDGTAKWDGSAADSSARKQKDVLGGVPKSKVDSNASFSYEIDENGVVKVYVTPSGEGATKTELYPSQPSTGAWKQ